jgi:small-conductance mechanosensitive channel
VQLILLGLGSLALAAISFFGGEFYAAFGSWQYRDPDAMAPTPRRIRAARYSGAVWLALAIAIFVGAGWPGEQLAKVWAFAIVLWVGMAVALVLSIVLRGWERRRDARRAAARRPWKHILSGRDLEEATEAAQTAAMAESPSEPSEAGYASEYIVIGIHVAILLVISFLLVGAVTPSHHATGTGGGSASESAIAGG